MRTELPSLGQLTDRQAFERGCRAVSILGRRHLVYLHLAQRFHSCLDYKRRAALKARFRRAKARSARAHESLSKVYRRLLLVGRIDEAARLASWAIDDIREAEEAFARSVAKGRISTLGRKTSKAMLAASGTYLSN